MALRSIEPFTGSENASETLSGLEKHTEYDLVSAVKRQSPFFYQPFWKVKIDGSVIGNGVVGVLEADFIEPAHDKQDFERSSLSVRLENRLKQMVHEYWYEEKAQKEADLKQTIEELEKGLEDMRKKCAHLSSLLESKQEPFGTRNYKLHLM